LFGVVRLLGGSVEDPAAFRESVTGNWAAVEAELLTRTTQTNEGGRCAVLLPVLAALPQPLALLEVGASAGLCLYPDRYAYRYGDHVLGDGAPVLDCVATGLTPPDRRPEVVWRAGLDLNPEFAEVVRGLPGHWLANDGRGNLPLGELPRPPDGPMPNVLVLDGRPLAWTGPHGQTITWFA
jgi:hypothetical protein